MKIQNAIILYSLLLGLPVGGWAQTETDSTALERRVRPIESPRLQGTREPSEEEKAYARLLAEEREEQAQIDYTLPLIDENGQVQSPADYYDPYLYDPWFYGYGGGYGAWRLHKGLNVNIGASVFANFGKGLGGNGAGFSQDVTLMYVTNLSKKATLAIGGYITTAPMAEPTIPREESTPSSAIDGTSIGAPTPMCRKPSTTTTYCPIAAMATPPSATPTGAASDGGAMATARLATCPPLPTIAPWTASVAV